MTITLQTNDIANFNSYPSQLISNFAEKVQEGECSKWNFIWMIPGNLIANIAGIILAPVSAILHLIACGVFKIAECCAKTRVEKFSMRFHAIKHLAGALEAVVDKPATLAIRLGQMNAKQSTNYGRDAFACMLQKHLESLDINLEVEDNNENDSDILNAVCQQLLGQEFSQIPDVY